MRSITGRGGLARLQAGVISGIALSILMCAVPASAEDTVRAVTLHVATFDSGFGGFLTAKSIEANSTSLLRDYNAKITIRHYGDTQNLPYGEKSPNQIAQLGSAGVLKAFSEGADMVFIACNTASTQFPRIREAVDAAYPGANRPVVSIIDVSVSEARRRLDEILKVRTHASLVIMATPATVRSMTYPRRLAELYGTPITEEPMLSFRQPRWYRTLGASVESLTQKSIIALPDGRRIDVYQLAPANWVELIEHGADMRTRRRAVHRDLGLMTAMLPANSAPDVVGYFCTHFPLLDGAIRADLAGRLPQASRTSYIAQGQLMGTLFRSMAIERLRNAPRARPASGEILARLLVEARPNITISGRNGAVTRELARTVFPHDPLPSITEEDLGMLERRTNEKQ